ncbi:DUF4290 domain-containing protein [Flaviaesturariibacter flavus]|uniref:DUF4290 domain-containing protein n=1 Tax=Flaviaesturariibacter flavus TaxID=2502780 RepID=A0A4R1B9F8_9BACT|nr:DUF4290 domain-containing protein [Flaviaesturariibacter flavus]TCJ13527.1 DUF4290 domain-containing protein [Flaviaesturariibacter flavus]
MEYNTGRPALIIREYGRHIQKMVEHLLTIEDRAHRQRQANYIVELMGFLNPHLKTIEDYRQKLWDHLFFITDFKLDVDSPYPKPTREEMAARPDPIPYPRRNPRYYHLGKNLELVIDKALKEEEPAKRQGFANAIAYYMKLAYNTWHKDAVHDDAIQQELANLTKGQLEFSNSGYVKQYRPSQDRENQPQGRYGKQNRYKRGGGGGQQSQPGQGSGGGKRNNNKYGKKRY